MKFKVGDKLITAKWPNSPFEVIYADRGIYELKSKDGFISANFATIIEAEAGLYESAPKQIECTCSGYQLLNFGHKCRRK